MTRPFILILGFFLLSAHFIEAQQSIIFWTDASGEKVRRIATDGTQQADVTPIHQRSPRDIVLDVPNNKMYWADDVTNKIFKANLDGTSPTTIVDAVDEEILGLDIDLVNAKIYWTQKNFVGTISWIKKADLDGSNIQTVYTANYQTALEDLVLDAPNNKMYWSDRYEELIKKADLDGSNVIDIAANLYDVYPLALDKVNQKIYWAYRDAGNSFYYIQQADLDGSNVVNITTTTGFCTTLLVDPANNALYWSNRISGTNNKIFKANLDGTNEQIFKSETEEFYFIDGLALDAANSKIYWTVVRDIVKRINLDGTNEETLIFTTESPTAIVVDPSNEKLYWADKHYGHIRQSELDGTNENIIITGLDTPYDLAIDVSGGHIYWTDNSAGKIQRANLDGSNVVDILVGLNNPKGIDLELIFNKIYWTEDNISNKIKRSNLDGSVVSELVTGLVDPIDIALNFGNGSMYWLDSGSRKIQRSSFGGNGITDVVTNIPAIPTSLTIDKANNKLIWYEPSALKQSELDGTNITTITSNVAVTNLSVASLNVLPVELTYFRGSHIDNQVQLSWSTASETNNFGFEIEQTTTLDNWKKIGFVNGNGTTSETSNYSFKTDLYQNEIHYYRLKQIDLDDKFEYSSIISIDSPAHASNLITIFPNPISNQINFNESISGSVQLFTAQGKLVKAITLHQQKTLRVGNISNGFYFLHFQNQNKTYPITIKQN